MERITAALRSLMMITSDGYPLRADRMSYVHNVDIDPFAQVSRAAGVLTLEANDMHSSCSWLHGKLRSSMSVYRTCDRCYGSAASYTLNLRPCDFSLLFLLMIFDLIINLIFGNNSIALRVWLRFC